MKCNPFFLSVLFLVSLLPISCDLREDPPEVIEGHVIWSANSGPIVLDQDIEVVAGAILEIEPGTEIRIVENSVHYRAGDAMDYRDPRIVVHGQLTCEGTESEPVVFRSSSQDSILGEILLRNETALSQPSQITWTHIRYVQGDDTPVLINHCSMESIYLVNCDQSMVSENRVGYIGISYSEGGMVFNNQVTSGISLFGDSTLVEGNTLLNLDNPNGAIKCSHNSRSLIRYNTIENCRIAFYLFSGSPVVQFNNIVNNEYNFLILPHYQNPDYDTIQAEMNWWGTTERSEIEGRIRYERNGSTSSHKTIDFVPFATEPFVWDKVQ